jgi:hypothetical protein
MMSIMGPSASNPNIKGAILHIWIFWQLTHQSLSLRLTPWGQTAGSAPQSLSLGYFTVQSIKRLCRQCSNSEAQPEHGGLPTLPPYLLVTMFHGVRSVLLSAHITYL